MSFEEAIVGVGVEGDGDIVFVPVMIEGI